MMIAACALGLGSCWINQLRWLQDRPAIRSALESIGLGTDEMVTGGLALGYAEKDDATRTPPERHGNPVTWVE